MISIQTELLAADFFGKKPNLAILKQAIRVYQTAARKGNASTKTRAQVSGGGRKPWKEKGTGRARQGSTRAPHWRGGGVIFGPTPRDFSLDFPQKMKKNALLVSLSQKAKDKKIRIIDDKILDKTKTKDANIIFKNIYEQNKKMPKVLLVINRQIKICDNLPYIKVKNINSLNVYDIIRNDEILITKKSLEGWKK